MAKIRATVSLEEDISNEIDNQAAAWYSDRSNTITRIYLEWKELRAANESRPVRLLPGFIPNEAVETMKVRPAVAGAARSEWDESFHLGTGPGDELGEAA